MKLTLMITFTTVALVAVAAGASAGIDNETIDALNSIKDIINKTEKKSEQMERFIGFLSLVVEDLEQDWKV